MTTILSTFFGHDLTDFIFLGVYTAVFLSTVLDLYRTC